MTSLRSAPAAVLLCLALPGVAAAQDDMLPRQEQYRMRVEGRFFQPSFTGTVQKGTVDSAGTVVDLSDDLGITDQSTYEVRGGIQFRPGHKLRVSFTQLDYNAEVAEARRSFTFADTTFDRFNRTASPPTTSSSY